MILNVTHGARSLEGATNVPVRRTAASSSASTDTARSDFAELLGEGIAGRKSAPAVIPAAVKPNPVSVTATVVKHAENAGTISPEAIVSAPTHAKGASTNTSNSVPGSVKAGSGVAISTAAPTVTAAQAASATQATAATPVAVANPGLQTLVNAMLNGSFQPTYVTDPSKLQEIDPAGTTYMPNFYYVSDQSAAQMAQLLGGTVVQRPAFGQNTAWLEPLANFIQLPNGQTFNAADVAYYSRCTGQGSNQLLADITASINAGSAWSGYYQNGGAMPQFQPGYVGPPISGMVYPSNMIGSDGNVINPQTTPLQGT